MTRTLVQVALSALCLAMWATPSSGQVYVGRIDITVSDSTGAVLPGVTVEATGPTNSTAVTDARGEAHFLNLAPGNYVVVAKLEGFGDYRNDNVPVGAGSSVPLQIALSVGGVAAQIDVRAETPVIDTRKQSVATNVSLDELQGIPTARDPWVVLQTVPGIIVDRVNVGGAESGQQSNYQAKGAAGGENTWNMDGIAITDMAALGSSPTYYDFDMFQEMQVTTGGADPSTPTPGVHLNFVLRGGTNRWRGSTRYYFENKDLQNDNLTDELSGQLNSYNRVAKYRDYGVEGGGPILKNKLFAWGAYGKTQPELEIFSNQNSPSPEIYLLSARDETILENYAAKVTAEISQKTRPSFTYFRGNKEKFGRGASGTRPDETTLNQTGPTSMYKGELNQTIGNNLFVTGRYAHTDGGFSLEPRGGRDVSSYIDDNEVNHGSWPFYQTDRPQDNASLDANIFKGQHELKFGFGWRKAAVASESGWPGTGIRSIHVGYPNMIAQVVRNWASAGEGVYYSAYVGDTITRGRLTLNLGANWGRASNLVSAASVPANGVIPDLLPALTATEQKDALVFSMISPRLGVTYALDESRKTIIRGSYAMFASQLQAVLASSLVSQIPYYSYVYYDAVDLNGNQIADANELTDFQGSLGFDPDNPLGGNPDKIGDYNKPKTHEFIIGAEHELIRNLGVSASFTWRRFTDFNWLHYRDVTSADYTQVGTLAATTAPIGQYSVPLFTVNPSAVPDDFGRVYEGRDGYHQRFWGIEVTATKRMADNWMMRLGFSTNDHREYFDGPDAIQDPTPTISTTVANPNVDGGLVLRPSSGSGKSSIFMVLPKYAFNASGVYQARWGINLGMNYVFRQGFSTPFFRSRTPGSADDFAPSGKQVLVVSDVGDARLPNVHSVDGRISKALNFRRLNADLDFDVFNIFNVGTILGRGYDLRLTNFNRVQEIMNPRIVRLGVRVGF